METRKRRSALGAALLTLFGNGAGFLYLGRFWYALGLALGPWVILALVAWSHLIFSVAWFYATFSILILLVLAAPVVAAIWARRLGEVTLRRYQRWYYYVVWMVVFGVVVNVALSLRAELFGYETFSFPSTSMQDTLLSGDFFVSNARKYRDAAPARGDLIVFLYPRDPSIKYVKRVIGLPGETVDIKNGVVYVDGKQLSEPYVNTANNSHTRMFDSSAKVPANAFFVLGDNRDHSSDSRVWGFVGSDHLRGSIEFIWFSYDRSNGVRFDRLGTRPM